MTFNSGDNSIVASINDYLSVNDAQYSLAKKARSVNRGLDRVTFLIQSSNDTSQWDDTNYTNHPIINFELIEGQRDYNIQLDEDGNQVTSILSVSVCDNDGNWRDLYRVDVNDKGAEGIRFQDSDNGIPMMYDVVGDYLFVDPAPNYDKTGGLRVFVQRQADYFTDADTTKEAGFAHHFHDMLVLYACYDYLRFRDPQKSNVFQRDIEKRELELTTYYGQRDLTRNDVLTASDNDPF